MSSDRINWRTFLGNISNHRWFRKTAKYLLIKTVAEFIQSRQPTIMTIKIGSEKIPSGFFSRSSRSLRIAQEPTTIKTDFNIFYIFVYPRLKKATLFSGDKYKVEWLTLFLSADIFNVVLIGGSLPKN